MDSVGGQHKKPDAALKGGAIFKSKSKNRGTEQDGQIFLLMIFSKNEQTDLTSAQKKMLKEAVLGLREARK